VDAANQEAATSSFCGVLLSRASRSAMRRSSDSTNARTPGVISAARSSGIDNFSAMAKVSQSLADQETPVFAHDP